jgi:hypothetical protein
MQIRRIEFFAQYALVMHQKTYLQQESLPHEVPQELIPNNG